MQSCGSVEVSHGKIRVRRQEALGKAGVKEAVQTTPPDGTPPNLGGEKDTDIYGMLPLDKWAEELQEMAEYYPCMKEVFQNAHPHKIPAILFSTSVTCWLPLR